MIVDRYRGEHTTTSQVAVDHFSDAIFEIVAHRPNGGSGIGASLEADPGFIAAHALKGLACTILARSELWDTARTELASAKHFAKERGTTGFEDVLITALEAAIEKRLHRAADALDVFLAREATVLLCIKLSQSFRFMAGDREGMLSTTHASLPAWNDDLSGYGFMLGCHSFALEEMGQLQEAEQAGRAAVLAEPYDSWALHSVAHVFEMSNRPEAGADWLDGLRPTWKECNNFGFHVAWHRALFDLELGRMDRVLSVYDDEVRPTSTDDFRDVSNGVSMLWRLEQEGLDVGDRWNELAMIARKRTEDMSLMFAALHNLLALVATGDWDAANTLAATMRDLAQNGKCDQAEAARTVALPLAELILTCGRNRTTTASDLERLARDLQMIGGSHAQRDVFVRTLAKVARQRGDMVGMSRVLSVRAELKKKDRFNTLLSERVNARKSSLHLTPEGAAAFPA